MHEKTIKANNLEYVRLCMLIFCNILSRLNTYINLYRNAVQRRPSFNMCTDKIYYAGLKNYNCNWKTTYPKSLVKFPLEPSSYHSMILTSLMLKESIPRAIVNWSSECIEQNWEPVKKTKIWNPLHTTMLDFPESSWRTQQIKKTS